MKKALLLLFFITIPLFGSTNIDNDTSSQKRKSSYSSKRKKASKKRKYANRKNYSQTRNSCTYNGNSLNVGPRGGCYYYAASGNKVYVDRAYCGNCN